MLLLKHAHKNSVLVQAVDYESRLFIEPMVSVKYWYKNMIECYLNKKCYQTSTAGTHTDQGYLASTHLIINEDIETGER